MKKATHLIEYLTSIVEIKLPKIFKLVENFLRGDCKLSKSYLKS